MAIVISAYYPFLEEIFASKKSMKASIAITKVNSSPFMQALNRCQGQNGTATPALFAEREKPQLSRSTYKAATL